jgi:hypothetical protein
MGRWGILIGLCFVLAAGRAVAQQASPKKPNELVAGKLLYVAPMPANLDEWILDYLRRWGKYKVTGNPEGVDLVVKAYSPEKEMELEMRGGVPQPRGEGRRLPSPIPGKKHEELPAVSITVFDWVTNEPLWHADILDRKQKKDEANPPPGPQTKIFARGLATDQLAQRITAKLREYVGQLEQAQAGGQKQ